MILTLFFTLCSCKNNPIETGEMYASLPTPKTQIAHEPLSHYGNPSTYHEKGEKYQVLTSAQGYKAQGTASWYGPDFHKHRTSSGEPYNMYALTAAHKTLPLPTYVRVKNLENGQETVVKVNDRGPFHGDRVIDLSYAAAKKLGVIEKGTAPVEIVAIGTPPKANYYLQAGAFSTAKRAKALKYKLLSSNFNTTVNVEQRDNKFIVNLGPIANKQQSDLFKAKLKTHGILNAFSFLR